VLLNIWDTAGQERFRVIVSSYYRKAHGIVLAFDLTNRETFEAVAKHWLFEVERFAPPGVFILLVGTKSDLAEDRTVSRDEIDAFALKHDLAYVETSAKEDVDSVAVAFEKMVEGMIAAAPLNPIVRETVSLRTSVHTSPCC